MTEINSKSLLCSTPGVKGQHKCLLCCTFVTSYSITFVNISSTQKFVTPSDSLPFSCRRLRPPSLSPASCSQRFMYLSISSSTASLQNEFCLTAPAGVEVRETLKTSQHTTCAGSGTLTEDHFLDGQVLDLLLVISAPPVDVCGQRVGEKLRHYPPDTLFGRHPSSQAEVGDLQSRVVTEFLPLM